MRNPSADFHRKLKIDGQSGLNYVEFFYSFFFSCGAGVLLPLTDAPKVRVGCEKVGGKNDKPLRDKGGKFLTQQDRSIGIGSKMDDGRLTMDEGGGIENEELRMKKLRGGRYVKRQNVWTIL